MGERKPQLREAISDRLRYALELQGRSIRSLESAMSARGSDITSYGAIRAYVQGEKLPPLTFLMEAADDLSVRAQWLILGEGSMTEVEEHASAEDQEAKLLAAYPELTPWPETARDILTDVVVDYFLQAPDVASAGALGAWPELYRDIAFLTTLPLRCWGFKGLEDMSERERLTYLMNMLNTLRIALNEAGKGDPLEAREDSLLPHVRSDWS